MRKYLLLAAVMMLVASVALGATRDPWRIRITDFGDQAPTDTGRVASIVRVSFGSAGGTYLQYYWGGEGGFHSAKKDTAAVNTYTASTGALALGTTSATSIDSFSHAGFLGVGPQNVLKVGSVYKTWKRNNTWYGHDISYSVSNDGYNFSVETQCTTYGSSQQATASYGNHGFYRSTSGVYLRWHGNHSSNLSAPARSQAKGAATSGIGETEWWDIDTLDPYPQTTPQGDPIGDPHTWDGVSWDRHQRQEGGALMSRACDGNLFTFASHMEAYGISAGEGLGLYIGTAGELCSGDEYVWLSDPDSSQTDMYPSLLSSNTWPTAGLAGSSLRCAVPSSTWMAWEGVAVGLTASQTDPTSKFLLLYAACWDTDSDGTRETLGSGHAKLWLTRNAADLTYDGTVSAADISPFSTAYGSTTGQLLYNPDADFNKDGKVSSQDISPFSTRYGSDCSYTY